MIYLAQPYSHANPEVMKARYEVGLEVVAKGMQNGVHIYSPIVHNHPIAENYDMPRGWDFWSQFDIPMLRLASKFWILQLPGWQNSTGVGAEREAWEAMGERAKFYNPLQLELYHQYKDLLGGTAFN